MGSQTVKTSTMPKTGPSKLAVASPRLRQSVSGQNRKGNGKP